MEAQEAEANMALMDKKIQQTAEAMNALEAAVYKLRDDCSTVLSAYLTEPDKEKLSAMCTAMEDWLYDEGMDVEKGVYEAKLAELTAAFAPGVTRAKEADERPEAFAELGKAIEKFNAFAASTDEMYAHIETEQKQKVAAECASAQAWMAEQQAKCDAAPKTEDAPLKPADIRAKAGELSATCAPIMATPKPAPPPPPAPPPAEETPAAEGEAPPAAEGEGKGETPAEGPKPDK